LSVLEKRGQGEELRISPEGEESVSTAGDRALRQVIAQSVLFGRGPDAERLGEIVGVESRETVLVPGTGPVAPRGIVEKGLNFFGFAPIGTTLVEKERINLAPVGGTAVLSAGLLASFKGVVPQDARKDTIKDIGSDKRAKDVTKRDVFTPGGSIGEFSEPAQGFLSPEDTITRARQQDLIKAFVETKEKKAERTGILAPLEGAIQLDLGREARLLPTRNNV